MEEDIKKIIEKRDKERDIERQELDTMKNNETKEREEREKRIEGEKDDEFNKHGSMNWFIFRSVHFMYDVVGSLDITGYKTIGFYHNEYDGEIEYKILDPGELTEKYIYHYIQETPSKKDLVDMYSDHSDYYEGWLDCYKKDSREEVCDDIYNFVNNNEKKLILKRSEIVEKYK